jgi:hypothetical protein
VSVARGGGDRPVDFIGLHGGEIKEENDQPPILEFAFGAGRRFQGTFRRCQRISCDGLRLGYIWRRNLVGILHVEGDDLLRFVVFKDGEILGLETTHKIPVVVANRHIDQHQVGLRAKRIVRLFGG